jgi:hypothetical protein
MIELNGESATGQFDGLEIGNSLFDASGTVVRGLVSPNGLQNKPAIRSATNADGKTIIKGTLSSKPNQSYVVRFFSNPKGNEGKTFIGQKVTTNSDGNVSFTFSPTQRVGVGKTIAAAATGAEGTSEFSAAKEVVQQ